MVCVSIVYGVHLPVKDLYRLFGRELAALAAQQLPDQDPESPEGWALEEILHDLDRSFLSCPKGLGWLGCHTPGYDFRASGAREDNDAFILGVSLGTDWGYGVREAATEVPEGPGEALENEFREFLEANPRLAGLAPKMWAHAAHYD